MMILTELEKSLLFIFSSTLIKPLLGNGHYHRDVVLQFHFQPDQEYLNEFANRHDLVYHSKILDQYYKFVNKKVRRRNGLKMMKLNCSSTLESQHQKLC